MKAVAKYNTFKGASTALTFGTPLATLFACGDVIVHRSETALSATAIFTLLLILFFMKDKLLEYFKAPSALILSSVMLVLILVVENIIAPMKVICIATMIASGIDEVTFKAWYKSVEAGLPDISKNYKHVGFIFTTTKNIMENNYEQN